MWESQKPMRLLVVTKLNTSMEEHLAGRNQRESARTRAVNPKETSRTTEPFCLWVLFATRITNMLHLSGLILQIQTFLRSQLPPAPTPHHPGHRISSVHRRTNLWTKKQFSQLQKSPHAYTRSQVVPCCSSFCHWLGKHGTVTIRLCKLPFYIMWGFNCMQFKVYSTPYETVLFSEASIS